jgi:catechol 2,3-dioxygenase
MNPQSSTVEQTGVPESLLRDRITYGAVHLDVIDLESSLAFWRDLIGLGELPSEPGEARLGVDGRALVVLHPGAARPAGRGHAGLYHLAIHLPDEVEFARVLVRLGQAGAAQSPTDHIFSKATYLHDPDGILLELTLETPERFGSIERGPGTFAIIDSEGRRRAPTEPLDVAAAIAPLGAEDPRMGLAAGSYVGHVHLHVPDLKAANSFYRDLVGFEGHMNEEGFGMADLSAGGDFPHRIAINNWQGPGARQAPPGTAGMRHYELILQQPGELDALAGRAAASATPVSQNGNGSVSLADPAGNRFVVTQASR